MKYRLKDKELQETLEKAFPDFNERFQKSAEDQIDDNTDHILISSKECCCSRYRWQLRFEKDEIEKFKEYNPREWNKWPEVEPPDNEPMRIEYRLVDDEETFRTCGFYDSKYENWCIGDDVLAEFECAEFRFRPWEDEE